VALYAFDGTWNEAKTSEDPHYKNTNVARFYEAYRKHSSSDDLYVPGVGTRFDLVGRALGGAFGLGELPRIQEAHEHLCQRWVAGDQTIDIVGFSRGAATTLDFCHYIQEKGIRRPGTNDVIESAPKIRFLGIWDVVGAFGVANLGDVDMNIGHRLFLPKENVRYCFHALALDERRPSFLPTRLKGACEVWFRGVHSDVGGGNGNRGLNDIALKWMMSKALAAGLPIMRADISLLQPDPTTLPSKDNKLPVEVRLIAPVDRRHYTVSRLVDWTNPPDTCPVESVGDEERATEVGAIVVGLSQEERRSVAVLWKTATDTAEELDFPIEGIKEPLLALFQERAVLITNGAQLQEARENVVKIVSAAISGSQSRGLRLMNEFFLNEALSKLRRRFPFTDQ
jgi:uncharacterized protein (DUF2235 family)